MFNTKHFTQYLLILTILFSGLLVTSCSDDGDDDGNGCPDVSFINQNLTGKFMGSDYTVVEGEVAEDPFDDTQLRFKLYGEAVTGILCDNFNLDKPKESIIFSLPNAVGSYDLGVAEQLSLTFNDATIVNEVTADVALCGTIEITAINSASVSGKMDVEFDTNSFLNGNFTATNCN